MEALGYPNLPEISGLLSWERSKDRSIYTRANYPRILGRLFRRLRIFIP